MSSPPRPLKRPAVLDRIGTQHRVTGALLLAMLAVFILIGHQVLRVAREDGDTALRIQAGAQRDALHHSMIETLRGGTRADLPRLLKTSVAQGNLLCVEYLADDGTVLREDAPVFRADRPRWFGSLVALDNPVLHTRIEIDGRTMGQLRLQSSSLAYEDFLWHLFLRLSGVLVAAFLLLGWAIRLLLKFNLRGLTALRLAALRVESGEYGTRLPVRPYDPPEVRDTLRGFNHMNAVLEQLLASQGEQQQALDRTAAVTESDPAGNIISANELFCILSGYPREELIGGSHRIVHSGLHPPEFFRDLWETIRHGRTWHGEICNRARDGRLFWTATTIFPVCGEDGLPQKYVSIRFDLTQHKADEAALQAEKARWQITLQSISDAVLVTDARNRLVYLNPGAESLLGVAEEEARGRPLSELMAVERASGSEGPPRCFFATESPKTGHGGSARLHTRNGGMFTISYSCAPLAGNGSAGAVYVLRDETEKKRLLDNLRDLAFHDTLTGLPNRRAVEGRLARALRTAHDLAEQHAFCYLDLDQFKLVNDTCGHAVGDTLLRDLARTMRESLPKQAYLGRFGGDEFGLLLFDTPPDEAMRICRALVQGIRDFRFEHRGRRFALGACVGITAITGESASADEIMVRADMACYRAKSEGSGRVLQYEADEVGFRRLETEMGWAADFAQALEANQFLPYRQLIQPTSGTGQPHYEVLIRWQRNGVIEGPAKLLAALERYGQAPILDRWMVETVIAHLAARPDDTAVYFINLSGKTVADESFLETVCALLDRYGLPGGRLGFEVTETAAVVNLEDAQRLIQGLRPRGCQFALDDFGRDASSFFYLKHLPANYLKIDGAFVRGMLDDPRDQAIVRSIAQLARDFGMHSIAEQVENAEMAALLGEIGVDYLQGYHVHRPEAFPGWQAQGATRATRGPHLSVVK